MDAGRFVDSAFGAPTRKPGNRWGFTYYLPKAIPRDLALSVEVIVAMSDADAALGRLQGLGMVITDPSLLIGPYLRREALASSRIEGTQASLSGLLQSEVDATASFDREGATTATSDVRPTPEQVAAVLPEFIGDILQVPPAFSAVKVDGERAYDLARAGETVELKAREVSIYAARVIAAPDADHVEIEVECGKGTYVRAIVRDIAEKLGACAHVSALRRTRVGPFGEDSAITLELLEDLGHKARCSEALLPVETALDDIPELAVTAEDAFKLKQGRPIVLVPRQVEALKARLTPGTRTVSAMEGGSLVALCEMRAGKLEPSRVFHLNQSGD